MKFRIQLIALLALLLMGCNDEGSSIRDDFAVGNVECTPFIGSVTLNWTPPAAKDYYYTLISYVNTEGKQVNKKVSRFDTDAQGKVSTVVGGFTDTREYEFTLTAYGYDGSHSAPVSVKGVPLDIKTAKDYVMSTIVVEPASSGADISWTNETGVGVDLIVQFVDRYGKDRKETVDATKTGKYTAKMFIVETKVTVYAVNHADGAKSEEKSYMITPTTDPDDIIYDDIEYITFPSSGNQISISQENPDNPYEYTFKTNGGDPYVPCKGLKAPIQGKTLVFRYRASEEFKLELFWCNAGGGAAGGRSTVVTVPANNTDEWKTFRHDYSSAMSKHSWAGNIGDFARFDWGTKAGLTIHVRNIHFE